MYIKSPLNYTGGKYKLLGQISSNDNGGFGLRFPVFVRIRDDKDETSIY